MTQEGKSLVPIEGQFRHLEENQDVTRAFLTMPQVTSVDLAHYSIVGKNKVKWTVEEQIAMCQEPPPARKVRTHPFFGYYYLEVGYIETELDLIFGNGNWGVEPMPGFPQFFKALTKTNKGEEYMVCIVELVMLVQWADLEQPPIQVRGTGEADFIPSNSNASFSATKNAAISEAKKVAARNLGRRFGSNLHDDVVKGGLLKELKLEEDREVVLGSVGTRLAPANEKGEEGEMLMTQALLEALALKATGSPLASLDGQGIASLAPLIQALPTLAEKQVLQAEASKFLITVKEGTTYRELKQEVEQAREKKLKDLDI